MAVRTYPIRVAGNSGPLVNEITWEEVRQRSGYPTDIREFTTTTKKLRRVGLFDLELVQRAAMVNRPTQIALHGSDYLSCRNKSIDRYEGLDSVALNFIERLYVTLRTPIELIGTGPANEEIIYRRQV